jgi:soluble lytic murein transglycosylase-like protein
MSVGAAAAVARIEEIQAMLGTLNNQPTTGGAAAPGATNFASVLQGATAAPAAAPAGGLGGTPSQFDGLIQQAATKHGVEPSLLKALIRQESNFNPSARSPAGASGLTQLMPGTAASLGVTDPTDPAQAIDGGAKYLRQQLDRFGGDKTKALAAYNAGPGAVQRHGGVPPYAETQNYVQKVLGYAREYAAAPAATPAPAAPNPGATAPVPTPPVLSTTPITT